MKKINSLKDWTNRITEDISTQTLKPKGIYSKVFKVLKENSCQPRLLYHIKLFLQTWQENKIFPWHREANEIHEHKTSTAKSTQRIYEDTTNANNTKEPQQKNAFNWDKD